MRVRRTAWLAVLFALLIVPMSAVGARSSQAQVNLTFALWDKNQIPAMQTIINEFERLHPTVKITIQQTPWAGYWNKLLTLTAGGSGYDVFWMNGPNFPTYASKGALLDLTPYMATDKVDLTQYPKSLIDLYSWKGHHYALVKDMDTIGLFYNKTIFDQMKMPYPTCNWTWQDYANAAQKLTVKQGGRTTQYGTMIYNTVQQVYGDIFASYGGGVLNAAKTRSIIGSPQNITAANLLQGMIKNGSAMAGTSTTALTEDLAFESGKIAMVLDGSWMVIPYTSMMKKGYTADVTCLPKGPNGRVSVIHGLGMVVNAHTKYPKEAWQFSAFLSSPFAASAQAKTGTVIPTLAGSQKPWVASRPTMHLQIFMDELSNTVQFPASLGFTEWWNLLVKDFDLMVLGKTTPKDTLTSVQTGMNTILTKYYPTP